MRTRWQRKRARRNQRNTLEERPDRSERELQLYLGASVSFELPLSSASLPPSTKLSGTEHHCQAATSLPHQNILHCLHLQLCSSMFNRLSPDGRVSQKPWTHRGWKSTPSVHIASTCIHLHPLAVQRHFSPHLLFCHLHLFNLLCSTHLRPRWVVCHQQTLQHTGNL